MLDHSYTLQAVMELQRSVGELTGTVDALKDLVKDQSRKLNWVMYGFFVAIGGSAVVFWLINKRFDAIADLVSKG